MQEGGAEVGGDVCLQFAIANNLATRLRQLNKSETIPFGSVISYVYDDAVTAEVVDDRHIKVGAEVTSLSAAAATLMGDPKKSVQGPMYWTYKGKTLRDIRNELGL